MRVIGLGPALQCCLLGGLLALGTHSARADKALTVEIPPQSLAGALADFAHQTGLQIIYVAKLAQSRASPGTRAGLGSKEALPALLAGTGLSFEFLNERTVRIFDSTHPAVAAPRPNAKAAKASGGAHAASFGVPEEEIVVLGSLDLNQLKIDEDIQDTAGSVSMVSGGHLEAQRLGELADYAAYLPSLNLDDGGVPSYYIVQIRGITSTTDASIVGYYIDDAPTGLSGSAGIAAAPELVPYDIERIEVRRGPQGTLGGAGAEIGEVRYVLNEPSVSEFEARVGADVGTTEHASRPGTSFQGMVNVPIVQDTLALRVSGYDVYSPGYIDNIYTGAKGANVLRRYGGRVAMLWRPAESLSVKVTALWNQINSQSDDFVKWTGVATARDEGDANIYNISQSWNTFSQDWPFSFAYEATTDLYSATVHWYPASMKVTSATAWSRSSRHATRDTTSSTGVSLPVLSGGAVPPGLSKFERHSDLDKFSQELRVSAPYGSRLEWLLGGFYTQEHNTDLSAEYAFDIHYQPIAFFAPAIWYQEVPTTFTQESLFADLTWHVTDRTDLVGGIRYDHDKMAYANNAGGAGIEPGGDSGQYSEGVTTWAATAQHHFTPAAMLYGRVATGFTPGTANGVGWNGAPLPPVRADRLTNYEVGIKSDFWERRWIVDLAAFYIDWKDIQVTHEDDVNGWSLVNGGRAKSRGLELSGSWSPLRALRFGYNATYIRDEFTELPPGAGMGFALTGYQLAQVPRWSAGVTADYDWPLKGSWVAHAGGALRWIGPLWTLQVNSRSEGGAPTYELPAYAIFDVNASISRSPLALQVFVRNLTDVRASRHSHLGIDPLGTVAYTEDCMVRPRTVGVGFDYGF